MRRIRRIRAPAAAVCMILGVFLLGRLTILASEGSGEEVSRQPDLTGVQEAADLFLQEDTVSVGSLFGQLFSGEISWQDMDWRELLPDVLLSGIRQQQSILRRLLFLILLSAVFSALADLYPDNRIGEMGFYVLYLLLAGFLLEDFTETGACIKENISGMAAFMKAAAPAYYLTVLSANGATTATLFYELLLLLISFVHMVIESVLLPAVQVYVLLGLVGQIPEEDFLSRFTDLLKTGIQWSMRTLLATVAGLQILRNMIAPALDSLKRSAVGRTAGAIPGIGNIVNSTTEILLASAVLIRNCLGVVILLLLLYGCLRPVFYIAVKTFLFRLLGAVSQPVADKRITGCLEILADGCGMYLSILIGVAAMFLLSVAVLAGAA